MSLQHNNDATNTEQANPSGAEGSTKEPDSTINIDTAQIPVVPLNQQFSGSTLENLSRLGVQTYNPDEVEKSILNQIDVAMAKEDAAARTRLFSIRKEIAEIHKLVKNTKIPDLPPNATQDDKEVVEGMQLARGLKLRKMDELKKQEAKLAREIKNREAASQKNSGQTALNFGLEGETESEKLIRTGKITPLEAALEESRTIAKGKAKVPQASTPPAASSSKKPAQQTTSTTTTTTTSSSSSSSTKKRTASSPPSNTPTTTTSTSSRSSVSQPPQRRAAKRQKVDIKSEDWDDEAEERDNSSDEDYEDKPIDGNKNANASASEESDGVESDELVDDTEILGSVGEDEDEPISKRKIKMEGENWVDDGNETSFQKRITEFLRLRWLNKIEKKRANGEEVPTEEPDLQEMENDDELDEDDIEFGGGMRVPREMYDNLFEYQKTGVRWMWELHCQNAGGIIGDEMGLGKTVQSICFLGALHHSKLLDGPCIVICPATLMTQWVREFHTWWPPFRVALLHGSGSHTGSRTDIINTIAKKGHILITTYEGLRINQEDLLKHRWEYIVMDEGHKIRNPDAEITLTCKKFPTTHRLILTGAPIQNNLTELWSLFDFVFPGRLGTLPIFQAQFEVPIAYANATPVQVQTAYKCAVALRDLINPYMLRRMKADVLKSLPNKTEQVLFCQLTDDQKDKYKSFLKGQEVQQVLDGRRHLLYAIDWMRKICNHPDLLLRDSPDKPEDYGNWERSGKLRVVEQILPMWQQQNHKVLLFCQTRQMLDIVEDFVKVKDYKYLRLDGVTAIKQRMALVDLFNNDPSITKVGGLGINLVGADRVLLFDPDWNPSTDVQARERVWRIGQKRDVTIYRLITSGTIEEKIYHRQIFKEFLTNKILKDPRQKRFFKSKNLHDLFTLGDNQSRSETSDIFANLNPDVNPNEHEEEGERKSNKKGKNRRARDEPKDEEEEEASTNKKRDDMKILRALFNGESLKGAVKHDAIMDQSNPEFIIVEYEANKIAEKAVEALRRSRQSIQRQQSAGVPTWTGRSGHAGAPQKFGSSSSSSFSSSSSSSSSSTPVPKPRFGSQSLLDTLTSPSPSKPSPSSSFLSTASVIPSSNVIRNFGSNQNKEKKKEERDKKEREKVGAVGFLNTNSVLSNNNNNNNNESNNGPMSSMSLLDKLKQGGGSGGRRTTFSDGVSVNVAPNQDMEQTLSAILEFLTEKGGSANTEEIIRKFRFSTLPEDAPIFRNMLKRIATFDPSTHAWTIKPEWVAD